MANSLLLKLRGISLGSSGVDLFGGANLNIHAGDRIALVGRNGSGKSTLLKILFGSVEPDDGERRSLPALGIGYLEQDPKIGPGQTLGSYARSELTSYQGYLVDIAVKGLAFDPDIPVEEASGGELRKAALARLFAVERDLLLIDEPTNHLDISAILWLEETLSATESAFVLISHDRSLLKGVTRRTVWIDRGQLRTSPEGYGNFEDWCDEVRIQEESRRRKLERKISVESKWSQEGISARRKRNQGRLRRLEELREQRKSLRAWQTAAKFNPPEPHIANQQIIEALHVCKAFGDRTIVDDFSIRILKGDRVAIIGPNGAGKSTLLRILTRNGRADKGTIRLGYDVKMAALWQDRMVANPKLSVQEYLAGKGANARDRPDFVVFNGRTRHVKSYLKDYQFEHWYAEAPLKSLSGGELGRLMLARIMLRESNLLILDEPTNDLDVETLDMLQDTLFNYKGTVLFVSHDRDFLDNVATMTVVHEGLGRWGAYAGSWSSFVQEQGVKTVKTDLLDSGRSNRKSGGHRPETSNRNRQLTFTERHRLGQIPGQIDNLEGKIRRTENLLNSPGFYEKDVEFFATTATQAAGLRRELEELENEWLELMEKAEIPSGSN